MSGFGYDPDVPAGYQDADLEQAELERRGTELAQADRRRCTVKVDVGFGMRERCVKPARHKGDHSAVEDIDAAIERAERYGWPIPGAQEGSAQ